LDYLKNKAKYGDMAVLELTFRNVRESGRKIDPATGVSILIFSEAEIEKNKKIFQKKTRPAGAGWPKRLKLVRATHMAILPLSL
jgi:hypothetical protein